MVNLHDVERVPHDKVTRRHGGLWGVRAIECPHFPMIGPPPGDSIAARRRHAGLRAPSAHLDYQIGQRMSKLTLFW